MEGVRNVFQASELNNRATDMYQESFLGKYEVWRPRAIESVEKKWEKFRDIVMECANDVCGMSREERAVNGEMKKCVGRWPKREEPLRNSFREEIGLPVTVTGPREWL